MEVDTYFKSVKEYLEFSKVKLAQGDLQAALGAALIAYDTSNQLIKHIYRLQREASSAEVTAEMDPK